MSISNFKPCKNQAILNVIEEGQSRSRPAFWHQKARGQEFQASVALLCDLGCYQMQQGMSSDVKRECQQMKIIYWLHFWCNHWFHLFLQTDFIRKICFCLQNLNAGLNLSASWIETFFIISKKAKHGRIFFPVSELFASFCTFYS